MDQEAKARLERVFETDILEQRKYKCGNCGTDHKVRVKLVVPREAGGQLVETNAVVVCRACEMTADTAAILPGSEGARRIINFWVSRRLYDRMNTSTSSSRGLRSLSQFVRYLISSFVADEARFDDLDRYQDTDDPDVKVNVWVPIVDYEAFKKLVNERGLSVTDAVKSLIQMFDAEVIVPLPGSTSNV